ncbi:MULTISPECIES: hypothetical protein [Brachybacterium]|uniref:hypothetical protein n=1 Tax=Brachybacterium TaxID=43668 RepID=UPI001F5431F8|nr:MULTISPECIES: hypothetical protein [Brachybacterium]
MTGSTGGPRGTSGPRTAGGPRGAGSPRGAVARRRREARGGPQRRGDSRIALAAVREVWAQRSGTRSRGDLLYVVYLVVLTLLLIGVPVVRAAGQALARPDVLPLLLLDRAPQASTAIPLAAAAALVLLGAVRGPALLSPFFTASLASSGIPRRAVLWRPFARALLAPVLALTVPAVLVAITLVAVSASDVGDLLLFMLAAGGGGMLLGVAWLSGQLLGTAARRLLALGLAAASGAIMLLPVGVGQGGAYPTGDEHAAASAGGLLVAGALAVGISVPLLDRLRGVVLREQALRWEAATVVASTMDLGGTVGAFRLPPSTGRRLCAIGSGPLVLLYARRDAIAWLRNPERLVGGVLGALLAAAAIGGSSMITGPLSWFLLAAGTLGLWSASGTMVDGIRHGIQTLGAPQLFGQTAARQVLLHATAPLLLLAVLGAVGGAVGALVSGGSGDASGLVDAVLLPPALAPVLIAGRARDAAKGQMPLAFSTPMPTPQGDISVLLMLGWQADALVLALLAGGLLLTLGTAGAAWLLGACAVLTALLTMMTRGRLRALRA